MKKHNIINYRDQIITHLGLSKSNSLQEVEEFLLRINKSDYIYLYYKKLDGYSGDTKALDLFNYIQTKK